MGWIEKCYKSIDDNKHYDSKELSSLASVDVTTITRSLKDIGEIRNGKKTFLGCEIKKKRKQSKKYFKTIALDKGVSLQLENLAKDCSISELLTKWMESIRICNCKAVIVLSGDFSECSDCNSIFRKPLPGEVKNMFLHR